MDRIDHRVPKVGERCSTCLQHAKGMIRGCGILKAKLGTKPLALLWVPAPRANTVARLIGSAISMLPSPHKVSLVPSGMTPCFKGRIARRPIPS